MANHTAGLQQCGCHFPPAPCYHRLVMEAAINRP